MNTTSDRTGLAFLCLFAFVTLAACGTKDQPQPVGLVPDASAAAVVEAGPVDITKCRKGVKTAFSLYHLSVIWRQA